MLKDWLKDHNGELVKIGAQTAFLFIGDVDSDIERNLEKVAWTHKPKIPSLLYREVMFTYPSLEEIDEGTIVIVEGAEKGRYWTKAEYAYWNNNRRTHKRDDRFNLDMDDN